MKAAAVIFIFPFLLKNHFRILFQNAKQKLFLPKELALFTVSPELYDREAILFFANFHLGNGGHMTL